MAPPQSTAAGRAIAVLDCEDAAKWEGFNAQAWKEMFHHPGDIWHFFKCTAGEFPSVEESSGFAFLVVTGSHYSVNDDYVWIATLLDVLPKYVERKVRVLGACFGCQALAKALGGRVGPNPSQKFVLMTEVVEAVENLEEVLHSSVGKRSNNGDDNDALAPIGLDAVFPSPKSLRLLKSHGEQVLELPKGAQVLMTSSTAAFEMWCYGSTVLGCQFHPEMTGAVAAHKILPHIAASHGMSQPESDAARASLLSDSKDRFWIAQWIDKFLTGATLDSQDASNVTEGRGDTLQDLVQGRKIPDETDEIIGSLDSPGTPTHEGRLQALRQTPEGSTVRFEHLARQRQDEQRWELLSHAMEGICSDVSGMFEERMEAYRQRYLQLAEMNDIAKQHFEATKDVSLALSQFAKDMHSRQAPLDGMLSELHDLESLLRALDEQVTKLDESASQLMTRLGITLDHSPPPSIYSQWMNRMGINFLSK